MNENPGAIFYAHALIKKTHNGRKFVDSRYCAQKTISVAITQPAIDSLSIKEFDNVVGILDYALKGIYEIYSDEWEFFEPCIQILPQYRELQIVVNMITKERLELSKKHNDWV